MDACVCSLFVVVSTVSLRLQSLKGDFLRLVNGGSFNGLELFHELSFQGLVVRIRPGAVFLQGLRNGDLEVQASPADLSGDFGPGELLELGQKLVQQGLAFLERLGIAGSSRGTGRVLKQG